MPRRRYICAFDSKLLPSCQPVKLLKGAFEFSNPDADLLTLVHVQRHGIGFLEPVLQRFHPFNRIPSTSIFSAYNYTFV